jgi:tRNA threonylcarbamoyladenosine modification (KEOPS) complex Cgi121 subunit
MPFGKSPRQAAGKHATTVHLCKCGRQIRGNAYYAHRAACVAFKAWRDGRNITI